MIQTIKPYGAIASKLIASISQYKNKYFIKDIYSNTYEVSKETYEEINHGRD